MSQYFKIKDRISRPLPVIIITVFISTIIFLMIINNLNNALADNIMKYSESVYIIERGIVENVPVYDDYIMSGKERFLRQYLLKKHLAAAEKFGVGRVGNDKDLTSLVQKGKLVKIDSGEQDNYYFYNVRKKYRYLTPSALSGLQKVAEKFQVNLKKHYNLLPDVKLALSSVLRPVAYQNNLRGRNLNASIVSTHSHGISFDIFYDDYYVVLPDIDDDGCTGKIKKQLRQRFGFILGDSLRRQFRTVLTETLIQMQKEGLLYAIHEKLQRCYHVTILERKQ